MQELLPAIGGIQDNEEEQTHTQSEAVTPSPVKSLRCFAICDEYVLSVTEVQLRYSRGTDITFRRCDVLGDSKTVLQY